MSKIIDKISLDFNYKIYASLFRVIIFSVLFIDLIYNYEFIFMYIHDFNNSISNFDRLFKTNYMYVYILFLISLVLGVLGIGKYYTCFLITLLYKIHTSIFPFQEWIDRIMVVNIFFLSFIDSFYFFAYKKSIPKKNNTGNLISNLGVYSIIIHTCFMYLNNISHKIFSDIWISGYAIYYSVLEFDLGLTPNLSIITSNFWITFIASYLIIFHQMFFTPLVFIKKTKLWIITLGVLIHSSMAALLLLAKFQFLVICLYGFFFTDKEIKQIKIFNRFFKDYNISQ